MRALIAMVIIGLLATTLVPVHASTVFEQGFYEFEANIAAMTYNGSWSTANTFGVQSRFSNAGVSNVSFGVEGKTLVIWRLVRQSSGNSFQVCINNTSCITITSDTTAAQYWYPFAITLPSGQNLITIHWVSGGVNLDSFMVLSDPDLTGGMPTAVPTVPTATVVPTATPAYTATPGPTPVHTATAVPTATPAFTATPYTLPDTIIAIEPNVSYGEWNGQIIAFDFRFTGGEILVGVLLTAVLGVQLFSWWSSGGKKKR